MLYSIIKGCTGDTTNFEWLIHIIDRVALPCELLQVIFYWWPQLYVHRRGLLYCRCLFNSKMHLRMDLSLIKLETFICGFKQISVPSTAPRVRWHPIRKVSDADHRRSLNVCGCRSKLCAPSLCPCSDGNYPKVYQDSGFRIQDILFSQIIQNDIENIHVLGWIQCAIMAIMHMSII